MGRKSTRIGKGDQRKKRGYAPKHRFNNNDLRCRRVETIECVPVIDDQAGANNIRAPIDGTSLVAKTISNAIAEGG